MTTNQIKYLKMINNLPKKEKKKELKWFRNFMDSSDKKSTLSKTGMAV